MVRPTPEELVAELDAKLETRSAALDGALATERGRIDDVEARVERTRERLREGRLEDGSRLLDAILREAGLSPAELVANLKWLQAERRKARH